LTSRLNLGENQLNLIKAITKTYFDFHSRRYGYRGLFMHDVSPVLSLIDTTPFTLVKGTVVVELSDQECLGHTTFRSGKRGAIVEVARKVNERLFFDILWAQLRRPTIACRFGRSAG
jgi:inosine-uridine nucleoside N-ribohydrolase